MEEKDQKPGDDGQKDDDEDPRLEFILLYLTKAIKLRQEKWSKMMQSEESVKMVMDFLNNPKVPQLIMYMSNAGALLPSNKFPPGAKSKFCYFIRHQEEPITMENFRDVLIFGDLSPKPIEELAVLVEEVFVPILCNTNNHVGWPAVVSEDVQKHVHAFKNTVYQAKGALSSQTLLPMPTGAEKVYEAEMAFDESEGEEVDLQLKAGIEGAVIRWASMISEVLKQSSTIAFAGGKHPTPYREIEFWNARLKNLECIYDQLRDPRVKKMARYLEITNSSYLPCFKTLFKNVVAAVIEARDITVYLKPMLGCFSKFDEADLTENDIYVKPLLHCCGLLWAHSRYYCSSAKITTLLQETSNLLIEAAQRQLDIMSMFQAELEDGYAKIDHCIKILELFMDSFEVVRQNLASYFPPDVEPQLWTFHPRNIFQRLMDFTERLRLMRSIFQTSVEFLKLEKVEVGGVRGRALSQKLTDILDEFTTLFQIFNNIKYEVLDPEDDGIYTEQKIFEEKCVDLDKKLASILSQAWDECYNIESMLKFIAVMSNLLERPIISAEVMPKFPRMIDTLNQELDTVKLIFDDGIANGPPVEKFYPPVASRVTWIHKLRHRILKPCEDFKELPYDLVKSEDAVHMLLKLDEMLDYLGNEETRVLSEWAASVPEICEINLNKPPLIRGPNKQLILNFDPQLTALLREIRYLKALNIENLPDEARDIFDRNEDFYQSIMNLTRTVEWYNHLRQNTLPVELALIQQEIEKIDEDLEEVLTAINWTMDIWDIINGVHVQLKQLEDRVRRAQDYVHKVVNNIETWALQPMYERKNGSPEELIDTDNREERLEIRHELIEKSSEEVKKILNYNYRLFFNFAIPEPSIEEVEGEEKVEEEAEVEELLDEYGGTEFLDEAVASDEEENKEAGEGEGAEGGEAKKEGEEGVEGAASKTEDVGAGAAAMAKSKSGMQAAQDKSKSKVDVDAKKEKSATGVGEAGEQSQEQIHDETLTPEEQEARAALWLPYEEYIDGLISSKMVLAVMVSLTVFMDEMETEKGLEPFFEIMLELREPRIVFDPSIVIEDPEGFYMKTQELLDDIIDQATYMERASKTNDEENYYADINANGEIRDYYGETVSRITLCMDQCEQYGKSFNQYQYLWMDNRANYLKQFLLYARQLTPEEEEFLKKEDSPGIKETPPTTPQFKEQIDFYEELYKKISKLPETHVIDGWLRIDQRPLRQAILNVICKWSNMFKQHLIDHVTNSLSELNEFIDKAVEEMQKPVVEGDYDSLIRVMNYLFEVKERQATADYMFEPLKEIMELLYTYGVEFPEQVYTLLQELPDKWLYCKKVAVTTKQAVAPLQAAEVNLIKKRVALFDIRQNQYRENFKKGRFLNWDCPNIYLLLDKTNREIADMEEQAVKLTEQSNLFELPTPEFKYVKVCRKELKQIKQLWDYVNIVRSCFDEWKTTPWSKIDVEGMEMECKKFAKEIRQMDKDMRTWDVYLHCEAAIKNLLSSLRAVTELQNPAIRDRHWQQLMQATKVKFTMDESTTLKDLLDLNLHEYEEEVKNIVDKSVKEMSMEKVLKELAAVWNTMEFEYETHERTKIKLIRVSEELIETLEDHQVQLQNMMSSKFIGYFFDEVQDWQKKLSNADQVIQAFLEVQRKWCYLESIFIGSEDIRSQLAEDSKRFDKIDKDFKELVRDMCATPNVVKATNKPGLYEKLDYLLSQLVLCEKALNDYLDTKRLAFPRFYFVSSADLLDILSNGNQPEMVARHLTKLFDSLAKLVFIQEGGKNTKRAKEMISKENEEHVAFCTPCDCSGKVETWLNRVIDLMRQTLQGIFLKAITAYEDKPRDQWVFDFPAQPALCGTQIWWTTEVNLAFAKLEEGYENAMKDYQKKQIVQLNALIVLLLGDLSEGDRQKIMTICTIDVHSRDVVFKMIAMKVDNSQAFQWQSQLRHRWDEQLVDCYANICDAQFRYQYEYLGNTPRLVITPLTDRCYITLTQSLHLIMGGAPAGPAGTGKTETTKDLGRALGVMVYVFNCSEQMDYKSIAGIYKGLSQTGTWGCFDEFNRISVEVLSVVSVQVKSIQDAIKNKKAKFYLQGEHISLVPTVGIFITMNPGYAGRTELPENLKALFRPCAMVVPDFELICEIMLVAEGFQDARLLARKFITLYTLCKELLSKQDHYDWGLRAIKSVLVVAGSLKRSDRQRPEDQVLMRALRDFNIPKIVTDDVPVFMGLIGDLFPALDVPRKRNFDFEKLIKKSALDLKLQPEDGFVLKVVQLEELFAVRHSVFIVGFAGTGKTQVWKTLNKTYYNQKRKPTYNDINPKAVTNDELFGVINPATREWKDGLFSVIMRDQANLTGDGPKWIVLDGDIDPMWIESLNTLMDDNKILTLASNERIALTTHMRLLFEISNLRTATPATVSRAGILYINPADLGWNPYVASWVETRPQAERPGLLILFDKYVPPCLEVLRTKLKKITPIPEIAHIQMLCFLLDCFLVPSNVPTECPKEWYEIYFVFGVIWAFGSALFQDQIIDWRNEFHKWFTNEFKAVKFPHALTVFHYYIDPETKQMMPWSNLVQPFEMDPDIPLQSTLVNTNETTRLRFFMDLLMKDKHPVMFIGGAGSGKTVLIGDKLAGISEAYAVTNVPFNFYTTSEMLQKILEKPLEKKSGRNYGPPGSKTMIYFVDDMNMPEVDKYGTVQPHTILRQYMDYQHWYDRQKLTLKDIHNVQFVSSMNPTAGSFTIDARLQRHFCVFAMSFPGAEAVYHIYSSMFQQHVENHLNKFNPNLYKMVPPIVKAAQAFHLKMMQSFLPTAVKFHYIFNLRDLSNVFQGMLFSTGDAIKTVNDMIRLWMHETTRVYGDKMVEVKDMQLFQKLLKEGVKKGFEEFDETTVMKTPLIYCHFAEGIGDPKYFPIHEYTDLNKLLEDALSGYNDLIAACNLVLFEDAMNHICRINRIMESPRGNSLLVGVGGSGKQSLSRLAAFISSLEVFQVQIRKGYNMNDLKTDLSGQYLKAGMKSMGICFLMTDAQVAEEAFLVLINDMLASGEIPELLADDEMENVINAMRGEVKSAGMQDTRENCWKFFIDRVRRLMKVTLCFSPVGSTLRIRGRKFPAIVNTTSIDWFHEWPQEALESVSARFLAEIEDLPKQYVRSVSLFMSYVHTVVNEMSQSYLMNEKRYNYTTPKSFLEQIALYSKLLTEKTSNLCTRIIRLENGLLKLASTSEEVDGLKEILAVQEVVLGEKNEAAEKLIQVVSAENEKVSVEQAIAAEEEKKVQVIEADVTIKAKICADDLQKAEPALVAAQAALNTLNKNNLTELKSFGSPPAAVVNVCAAVLVLMSPKGKVPKDRSWKACKLLMGNVGQFLTDLIEYDKEHIHPEVVKAIQPFITDPEFEPTFILSKSAAAGGLCAWVINIMKFYDVWLVVDPKRRALAQANADLTAARNKLAELKEKLAIFEETLNKLKEEYNAAVTAKLKCQAEADATATTIDLANRLVNGLASEKVRWRDTVADLQASTVKLPGDVLLVCAFISYVGCFTKRYRQDLMEKYWMPYLHKLEVPMPMSEISDPISMLTDDAQIALWNNEGLPSDRMSAENATILTNSSRWPLMIDPQLQGIKWIKNRYGSSLIVLRLNQKNYLDKIEQAIQNGNILLIENIYETVDAVLDPLLGRVLVKKGKCIKMGDKEVDYDPNFKLILQTKLANPHYKPEMQAQTTLINFTVTRDGLEEQLLAEVVKAERPDLEKLKSGLTKQQNDFKIILKNCEDTLLEKLSSAGEDILQDVDLVLNLEKTKATAAEIEIKAAEAKITSVKIDEAREQYRPAANRASLLYFILNDLFRINAIYQFSLKAFNTVFKDALARAEPAEKLKDRLVNLLDSITFSIFMYTNRGLFEKDKLIFMAQMTFQILLNSEEISPEELDFLLRYPAQTGVQSPFEFLTNLSWGGIKELTKMEEFKGLDKDIEGSSKRWGKFIESEAPEKDKYPGEWKNKNALQRLCIMRCLRPDRMTYAVKGFIEEKLGAKFVEARTVEFAKSYEETSASTPTFFVLSPGVNPLKEVEKLGKHLGFTIDKRNFHIVSLGQGQEVVAEHAMDVSSQHGHWVILENIHLVARWLPTLEKKMEQYNEGSHPNYRLYMSAEAAPDPSSNVLPQGILESSIKITNEPPTGMLANIHKALENFNQETLEMCSKEAEFKSILYALCYFHAVVAERRKFGPQGWNRNYPFNVGDLTISVNVLYNYLENNNKVPWEDLRYLFGEIMYGGHITDDWDRRLCRTYLQEYMQNELVDGELELAPGFLAPPNLDYPGYHKFTDDRLPTESPYLYGLHPNAEIGFLTMTSEVLFRTIFEMQPRDAGVSGGGGLSREDKVRGILEDIVDKLPEEFNIPEMMAKVEERTPYIIVAFQECERMNMLCRLMRQTLKELELGLKGELTITSDMEALEESLFMDTVPPDWAARAYPSLLPLGQWVADLGLRVRELEGWVGDFQMPAAIWLAGFFNPQSLLTAIMQQTARKNEWPLDKMCLNCEVTKKQREDFTSAPREGANIHGLYMEGARWDSNINSINDAILKDLFPVMPVIYIKAITQDKQDLRGMYDCPVYKTRQRGPTFVWTFNLKSKKKPAKWTLAGVAILLQI